MPQSSKTVYQIDSESNETIFSMETVVTEENDDSETMLDHKSK